MKKIGDYHILAAAFVIAAGSLLHFVYDWSGQNAVVAAFAAVNESTWEHLKLLFVPAVIFAIIEYFGYGKDTDNFLPAKAVSIFAGVMSIVVLFYTYTGIVGRNFAPADISTFIIGSILVYVISYKIIESGRLSTKKARILAGCALTALAVMFVVFTFYPPQIGLFKDPITGGYGIA